MTSKRPNTVIVLFLLIWEWILLLWESFFKWIYALVSGRVIPLRTSRLLQLWHWSMAKWPKKFWHFPRAIQIGRLISTTLQVVFYPKK